MMNTREFMREIILPVVVSVATGIGASYMATQLAVKVLETKVAYIETSLSSMKELLETSSANQLELARRAEWMRAKDEKMREQDARIGRLEFRVYESVPHARLP